MIILGLKILRNIAKQILVGNKKKTKVILDRTDAIKYAMNIHSLMT